MLDEDIISVSLTANKEHDADPLAKRAKFIQYTVCVRNKVTGGKCIVKRRYSDFYRLRKELIEMVAWHHCPHCDRYVDQIAGYPFPRRRLLRSSLMAVVKDRMDSLGLFLRQMLLYLMAGAFDDCEQAKPNIQRCLLKSFLEVEDPSGILSKTPVKSIIIHAIEEKRQQQVRVASLRTRVVDHVERPKKPRVHKPVDANTCQKCLQKWTNCYCNSEDDGELYAQYHRESESSCASNESDASRCSQCHADWDNCYCFQPASPSGVSSGLSSGLLSM